MTISIVVAGWGPPISEHSYAKTLWPLCPARCLAPELIPRAWCRPQGVAFSSSVGAWKVALSHHPEETSALTSFPLADTGAGELPLVLMWPHFPASKIIFPWAFPQVHSMNLVPREEASLAC